MNVTRAFSLTAAGILAALTRRMMAFLLLRARGQECDALPAVTRESRVRILAFAERLAAFTASFARIANLAEAGRLRVSRPPAFRRARTSSGPVDPRGGTAAVRLGGRFGWMLEFVPFEFRDDWAMRLTNVYTLAVIDLSRQAVRQLRWLSRGLGLVPPEGVFPVTPQRTHSARKAPAAHAAAPAGHAEPHAPLQAPGSPSHAPGADPTADWADKALSPGAEKLADDLARPGRSCAMPDLPPAVNTPACPRVAPALEQAFRPPPANPERLRPPEDFAFPPGVRERSVDELRRESAEAIARACQFPSGYGRLWYNRGH